MRVGQKLDHADMINVSSIKILCCICILESKCIKYRYNNS